jgi:homopolymeric O-antigen transport system ATP-binding protein
MPPIIEIRELSKEYQIGSSITKTNNVREVLSQGIRNALDLVRLKGAKNGGRPSSNSIWALKGINLDIERSDVLGIVGRNGAGKTTMLKVLSRITDPTEGTVTVRGRLASLLEVGTGFHPELTGRENIYLNGAILGMRKAEIVSKFDEIVSFAEIGDFLDTPVKRYSSGMYVRLAFAVAAHLDPEILVIDEVLAVGDTAFQKRCLGKMSEVSRGGRTVLFVSHNLGAIESLCNKCIVLNKGEIVFNGGPDEAIEFYMHSLTKQEGTSASHTFDLSAPPRSAKYTPCLKRLELYTDGDKPLSGGVPVGAQLKARVSFELRNPTPSFEVILAFFNLYGQRVFQAYSGFEPRDSAEFRVGSQTFVCDIPSFTLLPGEYNIQVELCIANGWVDVVHDACRLTVLEADYYGTGKPLQHGVFVLEQHWHLE